MSYKNKIIYAIIIILFSTVSSVITYKVSETRFNNLPDLIVTDVTYDAPYIYVHYMNQGSAGSKADFLIRASSNYNAFDGNRYYRFKVPAPGEEARTGGYSIGLIGLDKNTKSAIIMVEIDWEERVNENNEVNNVFYKQIELKQ